MADDLLGAYSSAQLIIMKDAADVAATVEVQAFAYGSAVYIYLVFAINTVVLLLVLGEALRNRGWKDLLHFDFTDPRSLIIGGSMGGHGIARLANTAWTDHRKPSYKYASPEIGRIRVVLHDNHQAIICPRAGAHKW